MSGLVLRLAVVATLTLLIVEMTAEEVCFAAGCQDDTCSNGGGSVDVTLTGVVITSNNKKLELKMQEDGNLVLYCKIGGSPIWNSSSYSTRPTVAKFQKDGNLVVSLSGRTKYSANSHNKGGARLVLQNDANLVIYTNYGLEIWSSKTGGKC